MPLRLPSGTFFLKNLAFCAIAYYYRAAIDSFPAYLAIAFLFVSLNTDTSSLSSQPEGDHDHDHDHAD
jgi:hypothetical protein